MTTNDTVQYSNEVSTYMHKIIMFFSNHFLFYRQNYILFILVVINVHYFFLAKHKIV